MKILIKVWTVIAMMLAAEGASAISLKFKFKTNSSGPNIYACNAGIMTPTHARVCYVEGTKSQCTPQNCDANGENCENSCVCTSAGGGDMLMNYAYTESRAWSDNPTDVGGPATPARVTSAGAQTDFNKFFADQASWDKILTTLSFNLGSELYNAQYFVDICFRGPQIEYYKDGVATNWSSLAQISATDFSEEGSEISYSQVSALKVKAFMTCDSQGNGTYKYAHSGSDANNGSYDSTANEATFSGPTGAPTGGGDIPLNSSGQFSLPLETSAKDLIKATLSFDPGSLRFCKVRYVFEETDSSKQQGQNSGPNLRKWQRHGAEICTYTEFNESEEQQVQRVLDLIKK
jgi:hypothetical protein